MREGGIPVCHVITRLDLGGAQENTLHTVRQLREPFSPSLVCGPGGLLDEEVLSDPRVDVTFVPALVRAIRPWSDVRALHRLAAIFRERRPRIVHTHSSKAGILGRIAARLAGVPIVVHSIHGYGFHAGQRWPLVAGLVALERAVSPLTTRFIAVSQANLRQGLRLGIIPQGRSSLIRSGVAIADFARAGRGRSSGGGTAARREIGVPPEAPLVGMVACLKPQKAPLDFVDVAARVLPLCPEARFVMVGDGELRDAVRERVLALGLESRLSLLGWRRDVPRIMAALDVMVLTSLWEGLPRVVPEAIAAGVPIVATLVDGTADILEDGVNALACGPRDVAGMASRVTRLLGDRALCERLADRARSLLAEFDIDAMVRAQESLYLDLLRGAGSTGLTGPVSEDRKPLRRNDLTPAA